MMRETIECAGSVSATLAGDEGEVVGCGSGSGVKERVASVTVANTGALV